MPLATASTPLGPDELTPTVDAAPTQSFFHACAPAVREKNHRLYRVYVTASDLLVISLGAGAVSLGVLVAFFQYTERTFMPIRDLAEKYNIMQAAMAAAERIFMLLDEPATVVNAPGAQPLETVKGDIEFRHVHFAYVPEEPVLRDVSFHIPAGTSVAIVGG